MPRFVKWSLVGRAGCVAIALASCSGGGNATTKGDAGSAKPDAAADTGGRGDATAGERDASRDTGDAKTGKGDASAGERDASRDTGDGASGDAAGNVCGTALLCETFDSYPGVTALADMQKLGLWNASLTAGATMGLDGIHATSQPDALHIHIDDAVTAGGRLFAETTQPLFATTPSHIYGRMMMYIDPNGTSINWTYFGVSGDAVQIPTDGGSRSASYDMCSLPKNGVNTYSFVYGLSSEGSDGFHDCSGQSSTSMPTATWACISFEMDSATRQLNMYMDGATTPILSVSNYGDDCVAPTPTASPWYGPAVAELFTGAWSYHPMNGPLDVWIDDLVVDVKPVAPCTAP